MIIPLLLLASLASPAPEPCHIARVRDRARHEPQLVTGRYRSGEQILYLATCGADSIAVSPAEWGSIEFALRVSADSFAVADRPHRTLVLERDAAGRVSAVRTTGFGLEPRHVRAATDAPALVEHLLFDASASSIAKAIKGEQGYVLADRVSARFPTRRGILRRAMALLGRPVAAPTAPASTDSGWRVPFPSAALLAPPMRAELSAAGAVIASRSRRPSEVHVLHRDTLVAGPDSFIVQIVSHGGHVGAVFAPVHPGARCCGTIVDIKGTSPTYTSLSLDLGPSSLRMLGSAATSYVFVVPSIRGEVLNAFGREYRSEGNRVDGWDGGAEDALSLLEAAATLVPSIDRSRVCTYGRSRGGAVALLAAERDRRIRCAVAISAPVDWFDAMWAGGEDKTIALDRAMRAHAMPTDANGQFIERIVAPVSRGEWTLADARRAMIASSPVYFARRLPPTLAIYGAEDTSVPSANARLLASAIGRASVTVMPMAGHDADPVEIVRRAPAFLAKYLGTPVGVRRRGADAR
jgi:pimeloyl-ACP methyl ester carboxylesterase